MADDWEDTTQTEQSGSDGWYPGDGSTFDNAMFAGSCMWLWPDIKAGWSTLTGKTAIQFSPPPGYSASSTVDYLNEKGVGAGSLIEMSPGTWWVYVSPEDADWAESLLSKIGA